MSQMRNWSSKDSPVGREPEHRPDGVDRGPRAGDGVRTADRSTRFRRTSPSRRPRPARRRSPGAPSGRRSGAAAAIRSSSTASVLALGDVHERRERRAAPVGEREVNSSRSRWNVRALVQVTPSAGDLGADADGVPDVEDVALLADRLAADRSRRGRPSSTTTWIPQRASSSAVVCPTGPCRGRAPGRRSGVVTVSPGAGPRPRGRARRSR